MMRSLTAISALALMTACGDGQPLFDVDEGETPDVEIELDGTENPDANSGISRIEPDAGEGIANETGGGLVREAIYDADTDTYLIDNLAFDGENTYEFEGTLAGYRIYAADEEVADALTGAPIGQIVPYRAITGRSDVLAANGEPRTSFAIVRTGGYLGYGLGGFVYERNGGVTLPTSGQAQWDGQYAGVRVFNPGGGLEYTAGDVAIAIDFEDFNLNNGVSGVISNRVAINTDGSLVNPNGLDGLPILPTIAFDIVQGVDTLLPTGEMTGTLSNARLNDNGELAPYETGAYYAIIAGDATSGDGGELVGVFVVESEHPDVDSLFVQETGGFILDRSQP